VPTSAQKRLGPNRPKHHDYWCQRYRHRLEFSIPDDSLREKTVSKWREMSLDTRLRHASLGNYYERDLLEAADRIKELESILSIVRRARMDGWYEDDPQWEPVDKYLLIYPK